MRVYHSHWSTPYVWSFIIEILFEFKMLLAAVGALILSVHRCCALASELHDLGIAYSTVRISRWDRQSFDWSELETLRIAKLRWH